MTVMIYFPLIAIILAVVCLISGCLFLVYNITLWRTKLTLEMAEIVHLDDPDLHDRAVEELVKLNNLRRRNKIRYIVFFTLSLLEYTLYV